VVRVGEMSSAFGSFLPRYDDAVNPLIGLPSAYGYYYKAVSILGVAGAQVDVTAGKFDMRAQLANSSPANPRSVFAHDQYANWAGGVGYTIRQGFRIGASSYYGPYLDRHIRTSSQVKRILTSCLPVRMGLMCNGAKDRGTPGENGDVSRRNIAQFRISPSTRDTANCGAC
jgi:hypothetical protein